MVVKCRVPLIRAVILVLTIVEVFGPMSVNMVPCMDKANLALRVHVRCQRETREKKGDQR